MNFKKTAALITAAVMSVSLLAACKDVEDDTVPVDGTPEASGQASDTEEAKAEVSAADITAAVMAEIELMSPVEKTAENIEAFYDIDTATVTDMSVFICGSGAYPDEIAVFRFTDEESGAAGGKAIMDRLAVQKSLYKDYTPDEFYKLEGAVTIPKGTWVIYVACSDNDRAKEIVEGLI